MTKLEQFTGSVSVQYSDQVFVSAIPTTRYTMATIPWSLSLGSDYMVALAIGGVNITSPVTLSAGITSSAIRSNADSALLTVALATTFPYQIASFNTVLTATSTNGVTARVLNSTSQQPIAGPQVTPASCTSYISQTGIRHCTQNVNIEILYNGQCSIQATFALTNITFSCATGISQSDCPIIGGSSTASVSFSVASGNFCEESVCWHPH